MFQLISGNQINKFDRENYYYITTLSIYYYYIIVVIFLEISEASSSVQNILCSFTILGAFSLPNTEFSQNAYKQKQ